jgi:hypothetical protein
MVMGKVSGATKNRGIWVLDRGGDRRKLMIPMLEKGYRFLIRLIGHRTLVWVGREMLADELAKDCPMLYAETVVNVNEGKEKVYHIEFG